MPPAGFEPAVPTNERPQTYALDRAAAGSAVTVYLLLKFERPNKCIILRHLSLFLKSATLDLFLFVSVEVSSFLYRYAKFWSMLIAAVFDICCLYNSSSWELQDLYISSRSRWPRGLRRGSASARLLRLWV